MNSAQIGILTSAYVLGSSFALAALFLPRRVWEKLGAVTERLPWLVIFPVSLGLVSLGGGTLIAGPLLLIGGQTSQGLAFLGAGVIIAFAMFWYSTRDDLMEDMGYIKALGFTVALSMVFPFLAVCSLLNTPG